MFSAFDIAHLWRENILVKRGLEHGTEKVFVLEQLALGIGVGREGGEYQGSVFTSHCFIAF